MSNGDFDGYKTSRSTLWMELVDTLEGRNGFALVLIKSRVNDTAILENNLGTVDVGLERKCVLHPIFVIAFRVVLTSVGSARFLAGSSGSDSLDGALQNVAQFKSLNKIAKQS